jgi:hypothetical protein
MTDFLFFFVIVFIFFRTFTALKMNRYTDLMNKYFKIFVQIAKIVIAIFLILYICSTFFDCLRLIIKGEILFFKVFNAFYGVSVLSVCLMFIYLLFKNRKPVSANCNAGQSTYQRSVACRRSSTLSNIGRILLNFLAAFLAVTAGVLLFVSMGGRRNY